MRELVERTIGADGRLGPVVQGARGTRSVTVNRRESALAWLAARGLVSARQEEAGERLRADFERAQLGGSVTMRWQPRVDGGGAAAEPGMAQLAAKRRFDGAMAAAGGGLKDVLWRVVCAGDSLADAERALAWPARSGRVILALGLDRVADFHGLK